MFGKVTVTSPGRPLNIQSVNVVTEYGLNENGIAYPISGNLNPDGVFYFNFSTDITQFTN